MEIGERRRGVRRSEHWNWIVKMDTSMMELLQTCSEKKKEKKNGEKVKKKEEEEEEAFFPLSNLIVLGKFPSH